MNQQASQPPLQKLPQQILRTLIIFMLPLLLVYGMAQRHNQQQPGAAQASEQPGLASWVQLIMAGTLPSPPGRDLARDLKVSTRNSLLIVGLIYGLTLLMSTGYGILLYQQRHHPKAVMSQLTALATLTALPPFLYYYAALKLEVLPFTQYSGGTIPLEPRLMGPILLFALFNGYFAANAAATREIFQDIYSQPYKGFYQGKGATPIQTVQLMARNWSRPLMVSALYLFPYFLAESVLFEFIFGIPGLGKLLWYCADFDTETASINLHVFTLLTVTTVFTASVQLSNILKTTLHTRVTP